jgi:hypothetical protein
MQSFAIQSIMPVQLQVVKSVSVSFETLVLDSQQLFTLFSKPQVSSRHQLSKIELDGVSTQKPASISARTSDVQVLVRNPLYAAPARLQIDRVSSNNVLTDANRLTIVVDGELSDSANGSIFADTPLGARLDVAINY